MFLPHPRVELSIVGSLRDREVTCSASDRHCSNFESCVWRTVSSHLSHHPQEVHLAQFSLYVHKGGLKPDSFHFSFCTPCMGIGNKTAHVRTIRSTIRTTFFIYVSSSFYAFQRFLFILISSFSAGNYV